MDFLVVKLYNPQGDATYSAHSATRALVQISVLKQNNRCDIAKPLSLQLSRLGYSNLKCCFCVCVLEKMRERSTLLLTAEITSPAGLRTVLHHGGSWNNDVTFEPQPGPDQMADLLIKYLSAPGNYPTSVWLFGGHCKTGC